MKYIFLMLIVMTMATTDFRQAKAAENTFDLQISELKNYQVNTAKMISAGLPNHQQFKLLKTMGVTNVIDLIPGDRSAESNLMKELDLNYHNIQVDWENPTLDDFQQYVQVMQSFISDEGITLTHCRLNWRGAVFTYLYRITQLNESEEVAKRDLLAIWQPNETWLHFIDDVKAKY